MSKLIKWLDHRMEVVGIGGWKDLSENSGVSHRVIGEMATCVSLSMINRSERRLIAATLRVSLRKLEQLDTGEIDWIEDKHVYDVAVEGRPAPWQESDPSYWAPKEIKSEDRGTPLIGSIRSNGQAQADGDWFEEWGRRIPLRYGKGKDIYALALENSGQSIVFRNIPPWEFHEGQAAIYLWNGWEAQGWFGHAYLQPTRARIITAGGNQHDFNQEDIVRIGKVIGRYSV